MKTINKKILPIYFEAVADGRKTFEIRKDEDDAQPGDTIILNEFDGNAYTGRSITFTISYVLRNIPEYGLDKDYCIIALQTSKNTIKENK